MIRALPFLLVLAACDAQPTATTQTAATAANGTVQTPVGTAVDRPAATRQDSITPGQWELASVTKTVTGDAVTPEMRTALVGRTAAVDSCIPATQAARPDPNFFTGGSANECKYTQAAFANGKLSATIACNGNAGTTTMQVGGTYDATTLVADATMRTSGADSGNMSQSVQLKGRRIGECRASQNTPR